MQYEIDKFMINIDLSNDMLMSSVFYISKIAAMVFGKIHIIDFTGNALKKYFTIDSEKNDKFIENTKEIIPKLVFVGEPIKDIRWIIDYVGNVNAEDLIFLNGAEKLIVNNDVKPVFRNEFFGTTNSVHFLEDENWEMFLEKLDSLYKIFQNKVSGIITNIYTDSICQKIICKQLEESENMSIVVSGNPFQDYENQILQHKLIEQIALLNLDESLAEIHKQRSKLGENRYGFFCAIAHYKNGNIGEAITILQKHYDELFETDKLLLADMYINIKDDLKAEQILKELYDKNKYINNLFVSFLRLYDENSEMFEFYLSEAAKYDPNNLAVIEMYATYLNRQSKFIDAAREFRRLGSYTNTEYYELIARMNEILTGDTSSNDVKKYIYEHIEKNSRLKNEGIYRLANYFIKEKESYFLAYTCLKDAELEYEKERVIDIVKLKMAILKDEKIASKALGKLKPFIKEKDAEKIAFERFNFIVSGIGIFACEKAGYLFWREFLEIQNEEIWNKYAYDYLMDVLLQIDDNQLEDCIDASDIYKMTQDTIQKIDDDLINNPKQAFINVLQLLKGIKNGNFDYQDAFSSDEEFIKTIMTPAEVINDDKMRIICRYYISIIMSISGKHQEANNNALSVLELYHLVDIPYRVLCLSLGLLAWGNSQYRIGRHTEGILCVIASIKYCIQSNEMVPFLEEGLNIICRFLSDEMNSGVSNNKECWDIVMKKFEKYNLNFGKMISIITDSMNVEKELYNKVVDGFYKDVEWAGDVVNLVGIYARKSDFKSAIKIIDQYGKQAIALLEKRKDLRFEVLYNWSYIYFTNIGDINNIYKALILIEQANADIEEKRKVWHREERGSIGAQSHKVLILYLDICCTILHCTDMNYEYKLMIENKIQEIVGNLSPRSIIEQKEYYGREIDLLKAKKIEKEYKLVLEEYKNLKQNNSDIEVLSKKAEQAERLLAQLKEIHPHYMSLEEHKTLTFQEIQNKLCEKEILYQCILTEVGVCEIIISSQDVEIGHRVFDIEKIDIHKLTQLYSEIMQEKESMKYLELQQLEQDISNAIATLLISYLDKTNVERMYYIQDYGLKMFPLSVISTDKFKLIDKVQSIVNIIDYASIVSFDRENQITGIANRCIGNPQDANIGIISKYLNKEQKEKFIYLQNDSDDLSNMKSVDIYGKANTIAIYGHGISDPTANVLNGAYGVEGKNKIFTLSEIIDDMKFANMIFISCRTGTPNNAMVEKSSGTWSTIFEKYKGNIILCKWDIDTRKTIELLDMVYKLVLDETLSLDRALVLAQRNIRQRYPKDPQYWSGIEFWTN